MRSTMSSRLKWRTRRTRRMKLLLLSSELARGGAVQIIETRVLSNMAPQVSMSIWQSSRARLSSTSIWIVYWHKQYTRPQSGLLFHGKCSSCASSRFSETPPPPQVFLRLQNVDLRRSQMLPAMKGAHWPRYCLAKTASSNQPAAAHACCCW